MLPHKHKLGICKKTLKIYSYLFRKIIAAVRNTISKISKFQSKISKDVLKISFLQKYKTEFVETHNWKNIKMLFLRLQYTFLE